MDFSPAGRPTCDCITNTDQVAYIEDCTKWQQPEIAMPSIFISNVMPRMPQLFGAVRIGPTGASENPGMAGIAGPEMQSSKFQIIQASPDGS